MVGLSADHLLAATSLVTVVSGTSRHRNCPNRVVLHRATGLPTPTLTMTEHVRTIARERVVGRVSLSGRVCVRSPVHALRVSC